ncbi:MULTISPECIES: DNA cytosine methyltransferase [unclassified Thioalkalivibrio]|uniref:DNA cytosine methyltransferase n=1 Tax=unclassified Thioalkalivibrio TaxID=2621013 RepID=UPI0003798FE1|nr:MULTISPECIES: DNA cytosine methyltransferase [unclassified Thioalkalivibrio]
MAGGAVIYSKIGEHRGRKRLWLEGGHLARAGIEPGQTFELSPLTRKPGGAAQGITLSFTPAGDRKVYQRKRRDRIFPVIDLKHEEIEKILGGAERVRVVVQSGRIEVTLHHHDAATRNRSQTLNGRIERGLPVRIGSLCHGGGVLDHALHSGLKSAGIDSTLAFANEVDGHYLSASLERNPVWSDKSVAIESPMQEIEWGTLPAIDLLVAGIPCTGASKSGRTKNRLANAEDHETAGALFVSFLAAIQSLNPSVVILENVPEYGNTVSMTVIRSVMASLGYSLHESVLDGFELGALERRKRFCLVATNEDIPFEFGSLRPIRQREQRIADVLEPIALNDPRWKSYDYLANKEARDKAAGKGFRRQLLTGTESSLGTIGRGYYRVRSTEPQIQHPVDPNLSRLLTPTEHARVKAIPEKLIHGLNPTRAHEILGQSVIHCAFEAVGRHLGLALKTLGAQQPLPLAHAC